MLDEAQSESVGRAWTAPTTRNSAARYLPVGLRGVGTDLARHTPTVNSAAPRTTACPQSRQTMRLPYAICATAPVRSVTVPLSSPVLGAALLGTSFAKAA